MAGAGFKTWVDGDILTAADVNTYLMEQAVMVFATSTARSTALPTPSEGMVSYLADSNVVEVYTGSAWVSLDDPNAIQNSIVDAKGDIITATADNTPARLAVGTNGHVLTADSTTATGLKWAAAAGGGKVLQVVQGTFSTLKDVTSTTPTDTGLTASITPSSTSSKVLVLVTQGMQAYRATSRADTKLRLVRGTTELDRQICSVNQGSGTETSVTVAMSFTYLDSPSTTTSTTYKTQQYSDGVALSRTQPDDNLSAIVLLEIGA